MKGFVIREYLLSGRYLLFKITVLWYSLILYGFFVPWTVWTSWIEGKSIGEGQWLFQRKKRINISAIKIKGILLFDIY